MTLVGLGSIGRLITHALKQLRTCALKDFRPDRQHPVFLLAQERMLHAIEHHDTGCLSVVDTRAVQKTAIGNDHSACVSIEVNCWWQLAHRFVGSKCLRQGEVTAWDYQSAAVVLVDVGDGRE